MTGSEFTITDGSVEYRHTKPRAEYESVVPFVRLNFIVAEGSDPETVAIKVMLMAKSVVENEGLAEPRKVAATVEKKQRPTSNPPSASTPPAPSPTPVVEEKQPEPEPEPDLGLGDDEPETTNVVSMEDLKAFANRAAKHVKNEFGNTNEVRKVINANGGNDNILTIPEDKRAAALEGFKSLLTLKK